MSTPKAVRPALVLDRSPIVPSILSARPTISTRTRVVRTEPLKAFKPSPTLPPGSPYPRHAFLPLLTAAPVPAAYLLAPATGSLHTDGPALLFDVAMRSAEAHPPQAAASQAAPNVAAPEGSTLFPGAASSQFRRAEPPSAAAGAAPQIGSPKTRLIIGSALDVKVRMIRSTGQTSKRPAGMTAIESKLGDDGHRGRHLGSIKNDTKKWSFIKHPAKKLSGQFDFVTLEGHPARPDSPACPNKIFLSKHGHDSIGKGEAVLSAGTVTFSNGDLQSWNNNSGHYKPCAGLALAQSGFPLDKFQPQEVPLRIEEKARRVQLAAQEKKDASIRTILRDCFSHTVSDIKALKQVRSQVHRPQRKRIPALAAEINLIPKTKIERMEILGKYNELQLANPEAPPATLCIRLAEFFPGYNHQFFMRLINDQKTAV